MAKTSALTRAEEARANAAAKFVKVKQADTAIWRELAKRREADVEKSARLRALRLEKEAADKDAAAAAPKPVAIRKRAVARPVAKPTTSQGNG